MAALAQALIPFFTGYIIDYASIDPNKTAFWRTTVELVIVSFVCAIATGVRGMLFTIAMTRLNVRIRSALFASLLRQEVGFYDSSKTGKSFLLIPNYIIAAFQSNYSLQSCISWELCSVYQWWWVLISNLFMLITTKIKCLCVVVP